LLGEALPAKGFKGYFVARFSQRFDAGGISHAGVISTEKEGEGKELSGWVKFPQGTYTVEVRVGVSFISVEQARRSVISYISTSAYVHPRSGGKADE
jgi:putative alpha-1,2-mannosidase